MRRRLPNVRRVRRGLTLLEVLICIGIVAALLSIAIPIGLRTLDEGEVASAEEEVAAELLKARVQAQEGRRPVEVLFEGVPPRLVVRWFDPAILGATGDETSPDAADPAVAGCRETELASSFRVVAMTDVGAETGLPADTAEPEVMAADSLRVAVFLPDGTLLLAAPFLLMHESGMRSSISVDPWTGHPSVSRRNAGEAAAGLDRISEDGSSEDGGFPEFESFDRPEVDPDAEPTPQRGGARGPR